MLWAKYLWRRYSPVNETQHKAKRPSFRPGLEILESREQPGSLLAVAAAVTYLPPASTFYADYSVAPTAIPTTPSTTSTDAPTAPAFTTPSASGDATAFYVAVTNAYTSITNAAATPYDPALTGDPTFSTSTDPSANQSSSPANNSSGSGAGSGSGAAASSSSGSSAGSSSSGSGSGSGSASSGSGSGGGSSSPSSGSTSSYSNTTTGGYTNTYTGVDSSGISITTTSTDSWTLTVSGTMSSTGSTSSQVYSDNYSTTITAAAPGGLTETASGSSGYTYTTSSSPTQSSYTYVGNDNYNSTTTQTQTVTSGASTTTLNWTWIAHQDDHRNTSGTTNSNGMNNTASDSGGGSTTNSSTDVGTYVRQLGLNGVGGSVSGTMSGGSSQGSSNSHSISLNGNSSGASTPSGTSSQSTNSSTHSGYNGSGSYIVGAGMASAGANTTTGGGTITESGFDGSANGYSNNASLDANGVWTVTSGTGSLAGLGFTLSSYIGNGAYSSTTANSTDAGTWNQNGGSNSSYLTLTSSSANSDGSWSTTGSSGGSGGNTQNSSYIGAGTYTVGSPGATTGVTGSGTTTESGSSGLTTTYNSHYSVYGAGSWYEDADAETSDASGSTNTSNNGSGGYVTPYSGGATAGTWTQDASDGSSYATHLVSTLTPGGYTWNLGYVPSYYTTTGTANNSGNDSADDTWNGAGAFVVSAGATMGAGTNTESGEDHSTDNYHGQYALDANGYWVGVSGTGSSNSYGDTHSGYTGGGAYVGAGGDGNGGAWTEGGGSDTNYNSWTTSTLSQFGWATSGGAGNGGDDNSNDTYNGAGTESLSYGGGGSPGGAASVGAATTTESGGNNASDQYSSDYDLGPGGVWYQIDGTASSNSGGNTHSAFTGNGGYGYSYVGGGMSGTWNEHGGSDTNFTAQSSSTYDPDAMQWVTTGGWSGGGDDNQTSGYSGSGPYDASAGNPPSSGSTVIMDGGSITESGSDTSSDNYNSSFALGANGVWTAVSGGDTSNAGGSTHSSYTGSGDVDSPQPGGGSVDSVWQVTEGGGTHYSMNTLSSLNADGTWATSGTGDSGGDDALTYEYSDAGYSASQGNILDGGAGQASDHYDVTFALTGDNGWQTTGGSAYAVESGYDDVFSPAPASTTTYLHWANSTLNPDGTWTTVTGPTTSSTPPAGSGSGALSGSGGGGPSSGSGSDASSGSGYSSGSGSGSSSSSGSGYGASPAAPLPVTSVIAAPPAFTHTVTTPGLKPSLPPAPTSLAGASQITIDANGNLTQVTDADGNQTAFTYNAAGQLTSQTDATGATITYTYDANGNLVSQMDALGRRRDYTYNAAGQVLTETWTNADGSIADVYRYTYNAAGQLLTASNHVGTYSYTYNAAGQVATQTDPWGLTLTYGYDAAGNKTSVTDSLGGQTTSTYNAANQLTSRTYTGPEVSSPVSVGLTYNAAGQLTNLTRYSGPATVATTAYGYDLAGDTASIVSQDGSGNTLADYQYNYGQGTGAVGGAPVIGSSTLSASQISDLLFSQTDNGVTTNYGYDSIGELTTAGATTEKYDAAGNRTNAGDVTGADNRLLTDGTWNYFYDAVGNETKKVNIATGETWTYGYDFNNRLTSAVEAAADGTVLQSIAYQYDVFGNRVEQDVTQGDATAVTRFAYDGQNAWADLDGNNNNALETRHLYLDGPDQPVARISAAGAVAWYLTDNVGSVRDIVNNNGVALDHIDYDAFGNVTNETNPAQGDRFRFQGMQWGGAVGLYHTLNREYDPQTGRWTTKDPSGLRAGDANQYRFVGNSPTNHTDPTGLWNAWNPLSWGTNNGPGEGWGDVLNPVGTSAHWGELWGAGAQGLTDGDYMLFNAMSFGQIPEINAAANQAIAQNGGLYGTANGFINVGVWTLYAAGALMAWSAVGLPTFNVGVSISPSGLPHVIYGTTTVVGGTTTTTWVGATGGGIGSLWIVGAPSAIVDASVTLTGIPILFPAAAVPAAVIAGSRPDVWSCATAAWNAFVRGWNPFGG